MSYIFGKLWHSAIIWPIRKSYKCILQGVRFLLANQTRLSGTSDNESYVHHKAFVWNVSQRWYSAVMMKYYNEMLTEFDDVMKCVKDNNLSLCIDHCNFLLQCCLPVLTTIHCSASSPGLQRQIAVHFQAHHHPRNNYWSQLDDIAYVIIASREDRWCWK